MSQTSTLKKSNSISNLSKSSKNNSADANEPSESVIKALLNYSKALSVRPSKSIKQVELILN